MSKLSTTPRISTIPKIIHQTWKTDEIPDKWKPYAASWQQLCKEHGWEYVLWTDEKNRAFIAEHYPWFLEKYDSYPQNIQRADAIRYFILYHYGGVYSDLDIGIQSPERFLQIYNLVKHEKIVLCKSINPVGSQDLTNALSMSQPRQDFWFVVWDQLFEPFRTRPWKRMMRKSPYFSVLFTTGPSMLSDACVEAQKRGLKVHKLPTNYMSQYPSNDYFVHEQGGSWHGSDAKHWLRMQKLLDHKNAIIISVLLGLVVSLAITVTILRSRLARH